MGKDQKPFMVMGYSFLKANQIDVILQEIMAIHWYSQWLPKSALTIRAEMRPDLNQNWMDFNEVRPTKRTINFTLEIDRSVAPEIVNQIIAVFGKAFHARMMAMLHGTKPDPSKQLATVTMNEFTKLRTDFEARKRQPNVIEWERYPIKAMVRAKHN